LNAEQILNHPWIVGEKTPRNKLPEVTNKIRQFNKTNKFKVCLSRKLHWLPWHLKELHLLFRARRLQNNTQINILFTKSNSKYI